MQLLYLLLFFNAFPQGMSLFKNGGKTWAWGVCVFSSIIVCKCLSACLWQLFGSSKIGYSAEFSRNWTGESLSNDRTTKECWDQPTSVHVCPLLHSFGIVHGEENTKTGQGELLCSCMNASSGKQWCISNATFPVHNHLIRSNANVEYLLNPWRHEYRESIWWNTQEHRGMCVMHCADSKTTFLMNQRA